MLDYQEMVAIIDRHLCFNTVTLKHLVDVAGIRRELESSWGLDPLDAQRVIWDMMDKELI